MKCFIYYELSVMVLDTLIEDELKLEDYNLC